MAIRGQALGVGKRPILGGFVGSRWQAPDFSLSKHSQIAFSANDQLVGLAEIRPYHPTQFSIHLHLFQTPSSNELGQQLLTTLEASLEPGTQMITHWTFDKILNIMHDFANSYSTMNLSSRQMRELIRGSGKNFKPLKPQVNSPENLVSKCSVEYKFLPHLFMSIILSKVQYPGVRQKCTEPTNLCRSRLRARSNVPGHGN